MSLQIKAFPEVFVKGDGPLVFGTRDKERYSFPTPSYGYGWVVPCAELHEAYFQQPFDPSTWFTVFADTVNNRFHPKWMDEGLNKNQYNPSIPEVLEAGDYHVFIYMACNDSKEIMDSIVMDHAYHEEVRGCLGNTETLKQEPAWFRFDVNGMPKGFKPDCISKPNAPASNTHPWDNTLSFSLASRTLTLGPFTLAIGSVSFKVRLHNVLARIVTWFSGH